MAKKQAGKVSDYTRCRGCGRLVEKKNAQRGPQGQLLGRECLAKINRAELEASRTAETVSKP